MRALSILFLALTACSQGLNIACDKDDHTVDPDITDMETDLPAETDEHDDTDAVENTSDSVGPGLEDLPLETVLTFGGDPYALELDLTSGDRAQQVTSLMVTARFRGDANLLATIQAHNNPVTVGLYQYVGFGEELDGFESNGWLEEVAGGTDIVLAWTISPVANMEANEVATVTFTFPHFDRFYSDPQSWALVESTATFRDKITDGLHGDHESTIVTIHR